MRDRYFGSRAPRGYELDPEIRAMVSFAPLNLAADAYPGAVDLIVCRNVLMYFTPEARRGTVARLARALAPDGRLALSPLDLALDAHTELEPVEVAGCRVHCRREASSERVADTPEAPPPPVLEHARSEADRGRLDAARTLCRRVLDADPLDLEAYLLLSAIEDERGDPGAAIDALRRAVYAAPESATAHFRLGGLLLRTGSGEPGRRSLETAAGLLGGERPDAPVPGAGGVTAGTLLTAARAHLEGAA
jgi:chemotaxis protein methyltransferase CheR